MDYAWDEAVTWTRFAEDTLVTSQACWLIGVVVVDEVDSITVFYDGRNANAQRMFSVRILGAGKRTVPVMFPKPLPVRNGLFVDVPAGVDDVLVIWRPKEDAPAAEAINAE